MRPDKPLMKWQQSILDSLSHGRPLRDPERQLVIGELQRLWLPKTWEMERRRVWRAEKTRLAAIVVHYLKGHTASAHIAKQETAKLLRFASVEAMEKTLKRARRERRTDKKRKNLSPSAS